MKRISCVKILDDTGTTTTGPTHYPVAANLNFQLTGETTADAGAASVVIEGCLLKDEASADWIWITIDTLALTLGTTITADSGVSTTPWYAVRARVASISGTGAQVRCYMAVEK